MNVRVWWVVVLVASFILTGCQKQVGPPHLKTTPVKGVVHINGEPMAGVIVECHEETQAAKPPPPRTIRTGADGKFCLSTYDYCDGLPDGNYSLTFKWQKIQTGPKDLLNAEYADPKKSKFKVTIQDRQPINLETIELTTKTKS